MKGPEVKTQIIPQKSADKIEPGSWEKAGFNSDTLTKTGRLFFIISFIGLAAEHFIFKDFITGRAPAWPASFRGGLVWAYSTGAFFFIVGIAAIFRKKARVALILAAIMIFVWAFIRNIPVMAEDMFMGGSWTKAGKALFFFGGLLVVAGTMPVEPSRRNATLLKYINSKKEFFVVGRLCLSLFVMIAGIQHFIFEEFVATLIPVWFPGNPVFWTYFAGFALIAGGTGLLIPYTVRMAALLTGLMVFSWFWIIHIPRTFISVSDGIAVFESLAVSGIAFMIAGYQEKSFVKN